MKKGIILLTTLLFIAVLSILVIDNLNKTDKYLKNQNYKLSTTQVLISISDIQKQFTKLVQENKSLIDEQLAEGSVEIPFYLHDIDMKIILSIYDKKNINYIADVSKQIEIKKFLELNGIYDYSVLEEVYKEKTTLVRNNIVSSDKQLDVIMNIFSKRVYSKDILTIQDQFGFSSSARYQLDIEIEYNDIKAEGKYYLNENGKVEYFNVDFI